LPYYKAVAENYSKSLKSILTDNLAMCYYLITVRGCRIPSIWVFNYQL